MNNTVSVAIPVAAVALLIVRQLRTRPVRQTAPLVLPAMLGVVGIAAMAMGVGSVTGHHPLPLAAVVLTAATLLLAAPFGWFRARSIAVWRDGTGRPMRRGTVFTALLWLLSIATHVALGAWIDRLAGGGLLGDGPGGEQPLNPEQCDGDTGGRRIASRQAHRYSPSSFLNGSSLIPPISLPDSHMAIYQA